MTRPRKPKPPPSIAELRESLTHAALQSLDFTVDGPPQPKQRARKGKGGHWYTPEATRQYERAIRLHAMASRYGAFGKGGWPRNGRYRVEVTAHFGDARRRDADNVGKAVLDACNGHLWDDDSQIETLTVHRRIDRLRPRTEVRIEVLP